MKKQFQLCQIPPERRGGGMKDVVSIERKRRQKAERKKVMPGLCPEHCVLHGWGKALLLSLIKKPSNHWQITNCVSEHFILRMNWDLVQRLEMSSWIKCNAFLSFFLFFFNCHLTFNKMLEWTGGGVRGISPVSRLTVSLWIRQEAARLRNTPTCNCTIRRARNLLARVPFVLRVNLAPLQSVSVIFRGRTATSGVRSEGLFLESWENMQGCDKVDAN